MATVPTTTIDTFKTHFHGVLLPGNDAYEHARKLWTAIERAQAEPAA